MDKALAAKIRIAQFAGGAQQKGLMRTLSSLIVFISSSFIVSSTVAGCGGAPATGSSTSPTVPPVTTISKTPIAQSTLYPRVIRLAHQNALVNGAAANGWLIANAGSVFESTNNGQTWSDIGAVPLAPNSARLCCATLFEMPQTVGSLAAGTLLYAVSACVGPTAADPCTDPQSKPAITLYTSVNQGQSWTYVAAVESGAAGSSTGGLWEPEFEIASDGALVMFWSDETDPCCSQKLAQTRTYDGVTWQAPANTVASAVYSDRPGMARVSELPDGAYFMTYEVCGPANNCAAFSRTSADGWNFGAATSLGNRITSTAGQYFEHAPANFWANTGGNGELLVVGQVLVESSGATSAQNGQLIFVNSGVDGSGIWSTMEAPVAVTDSLQNPYSSCPNYSSALLPSADGTSLLEMASDFNGSGNCQTYYAISALN